MFRGSIPPSVAAHVAEQTATWTSEQLWVGCSGNFTIERTLTGAGRAFELHSCDLTLYSSMIGSYFAPGMDLQVEIAEEYVERYGWLADGLEDRAERLATVMLASRLVAGLGKDNPYYLRIEDAFQRQWPQLMEKTTAKIRALDLRLAEYHAGDVVSWMQQCPPDAAAVSYPPFFSASAAFERDFAKLESLFLWPKPEFVELTEDRMDMLIASIMDRREWLLGTNVRLPDLEEHLVGQSKTTNRGLPIYMYANGGPVRITAPRQDLEYVFNPHLGPADDLGDRITLAPLSTGQFSMLRSEYMNANIRPGTATLAVAVLVDGVLIGCFAFSAAPTLSNWDTHIGGPTIYLLSDFPVANTKYTRLSKLVLYAALSHEAKTLAERISNKRIRAVVTTAFSNNPVSMKYRGLFRLLTRKEEKHAEQDWAKDIHPSDRYYSQKYTLNYGAAAGQWSLAEGLAEWRKRHGRTK